MQSGIEKLIENIITYSKLEERNKNSFHIYEES